MTTKLSTISLTDLDTVSGGTLPPPDPQPTTTSHVGDSLRKLAETEEGRKLLAQFLPRRNPGPTPV